MRTAAFVNLATQPSTTLTFLLLNWHLTGVERGRVERYFSHHVATVH